MMGAAYRMPSAAYMDANSSTRYAPKIFCDWRVTHPALGGTNGVILPVKMKSGRVEGDACVSVRNPATECFAALKTPLPTAVLASKLDVESDSGSPGVGRGENAPTVRESLRQQACTVYFDSHDTIVNDDTRRRA